MKFKKGDKVKVINKEHPKFECSGVVNEVDTSINNLDLPYSIKFGKVNLWFKSFWLELVEDLPEKYEEVEVRFRLGDKWKYSKFLCVNDFNEDAKYVTTTISGGMQYWKYMRRIKQPEEMTMEEVCKELGREIKIKKG